MARGGAMEKQLPKTKNPLVLRTDFEHPKEWKEICRIIREPIRAPMATFYACVKFLEDMEFRGVNEQQLLMRLGEYQHPMIFVVDTVGMTGPEYTVLVVNLLEEERGQSFRAIPSTVQALENNMSIYNMLFYDFAKRLDADGIFRGIRDEKR
jgi:hypothetical protein